MQHPRWMVGFLLVLVIASIGMSMFTSAQTAGGITVLKQEDVVGKTYPVMSAADNVVPFLREMDARAGSQGFFFSDNITTWALIETDQDDGSEAWVYRKELTTYLRMDCETGAFTWSSEAMDYGDYTDSTSPMSFAQLIQAECQSGSGEGGYSPAEWSNALESGKTIVTAASSGSTAPNPNPTTTAAKAVGELKKQPALNETCDTDNGIHLTIPMDEKFTGKRELGNPIAALNTAEYAARPKNISFTKDGVTIYVLQVWHFSKDKSFASSLVHRLDTEFDITFDLMREVAGQAIIDGPLTGLELFGVDVDAFQPLETLGNAGETYLQNHPDTTGINPSNRALILPGTEQYTIGMRLCANDKGSPKPYWEDVEYTNISGDNTPIPLLALFPKGWHTATFYSKVHGPVTIGFDIDSSIGIDEISINAQSDPAADVFRFRLTDETVDTLRKNNPELADKDGNPDTTDFYTTDQLHEIMTAKLVSKTTNVTNELSNLYTSPPLAQSPKLLEGTLFGAPNASRYLSSSPVVESVDSAGKPTEIIVNNPMYTGEYTLILSIKGYKDYKMDFSLTHDKLSTALTETITPDDIFQLAIPNMILERNCTTTCSNILSCLACVDTGMVSTYQK